MKFLISKTGLNIIASKNVTGRVTLTVENVVIQDVFDIMLRSNGLAYVKQGGIYNVMTEAEYKTFYGSNFYDTRQVKVFRLKYAVPEQAFTLLDALKSEIGRVLVDQESGNIMIMDAAEKISLMQRALEEYEKQNVVSVFVLKYAKAKEVEEILKAQLDTKKVGSVKADERNNQLIVQTLPERMQQVAGLIRGLDRQTKEIIIDAKVIKIKLSDQLDSGSEWEGIFKIANEHGMNYVGSYPFSVIQKSTDAWSSREQFLNKTMLGSVGAIPFSSTSSDVAASKKVTLGEKMHFGIVDGKHDFDVLFKYLQTLGKTRVLSNPKLVALNNQESKLHVGERQAYVTTTTSTSQSAGNTIAEQVTFVDVGIQLAVTPTINDDGYITMKVKPEISSVASTLTTPTGNKIPIIDTSMTETTVMMKDGTTLIIGGLRREERTASSEDLPLLSKIPFLGKAFKSETAKTERTEFLVMLTPHIISGDELDTGNERAFGDKPGKEYQDYRSISPDYQAPAAQRPASGELPSEAQIKPYRDELGVKDAGAKKMLIKEKIYEPY